MSRLLQRRGRIIITLLAVIFIGLQFVRPATTNPPVTGEITAPEDVKQILTKACYDCHSNQTDLKWFDKISPACWLVDQHIREGRQVLNFSEWDKLIPYAQKGKLFSAVNQVLFAQMPLKSYQWLHPKAKLNDSDVSILKKYLFTLSAFGPSDTATINAGEKQYSDWINRANQTAGTVIQSAPNNIAYIPGYDQWKVISTTDRFDNGTLRMIYGNDIAVKAIEEGHINPWPNGSTFAKVAWTAVTDADGHVQPGVFKQVEFMIKDKQRYAATKGWGWARWLGKELKPYGKDATFSNECVSCHTPLEKNDFIFTEPLKVTDSISTKPLPWLAITSAVDRKNNSMSTLYGNETAYKYATHNAAKLYPPGSVLELVTWQQQADDHWFGANVPRKIMSVETVTFDATGARYQLLQGPLLQPATGIAGTEQSQQINRIIDMKAVVFP